MNIPLLVFNDPTGQYISAIEGKRGHITVARHVQEVGELLGIAQTGIVKAALIVSQADAVTASTLSLLHEYGIAVVILRDPDDNRVLAHETVVSSLAEIDEILASIEQSVSELEYGSKTANTPNTETPKAPDTDTAHERTQPKNGKVVVIWGSSGAPGRSTIAVQTAAYLAHQNLDICLIDADTYAPSLAAMLGLIDDYSTLSQLAHYAEKGTLSTANFQETISTIRHGKNSFDIATGINHAERWPEIRQTAFTKVLETSTQIYDFTLVDVSPYIEADEEISFDGIVPLRNSCTRVALEMADHIIALGNADVIGIPRLLKSLEDLHRSDLILKPSAKIHPWVNKVRTGAVGNRPEEQIKEAWQRYQGQNPLAGYLPWEQEELDRACLLGQTLFEMGKKNRLTDALETLADSLSTQKKISAPDKVRLPEDSNRMLVQREHSVHQKKSWFRRGRFAQMHTKRR